MADQPLTICAVGAGSSPHVATRVRWFAERGHRVFLLTTSPSPHGIPGVVEVDLHPETRSSAATSLVGVPRRVRSRYGRCVHRVRLVGESGPNQTVAHPRTESEPSRKPFREGVYRVLGALDFLLALRRCKPDVIHVHYAYSDHAWLTGLLGSRPLAVTVLGGDVLFEEQGSPTAVGKWLTVRLLRQADYITTQSDFLADAVNSLGDFRTKTERILWGVSLDEFRRRDASALRRDLGLKPGARAVLSLKILQPFYRIDLVIEAMAIVRHRCPDAVLVVTEFAADAAYREELARLVAKLDLDEHVRFAGAVAEENVPDYYSLAELSIAVPPSDGLPQALLESLACETPQILSRLPRYEEIVQHEESAYFVDPNPESIAAGIVRLLEDEELRAKIARQGRRIVEAQANLDEQAERVERRFRELVAITRPRTLRLSALLSAAQGYVSFRRTA
jgi:glycosyltransferase involved in cell wall biosynthesis